MTRRLIQLGIVPLVLLSLILATCSGVPTLSPTPSPTQSPTLSPSPSPSPPPSTTITPSQTPTPTPEAPPPVPEEYQPLYQELSAELAHFEDTLNQKWDHNQGQTIFATELAFANGNVGEGLLSATSLDNNRILLDRLQAMGVKGVVLAIKYPLLSPDFPRSSEYLKFFKDIMAECRQHDMKVLVECGAIFAGTPYSPVQVDWSRYTTETFLQGLQDQLLVIAREVKPDYLTLANEPITEEGLTKLTITPTVWSDFIASTLGKIDRSSGLLLGAGTGTWENPAYINKIINMPGLDYIDLHIYPLNQDGLLLEHALDWALEARAAGKRVTISESWLWKASPEELGSGLGDTEKIMNRDVYGFWYPLDARFMQDIMNLADATNMDFISLFWMRNFFAYLDYDTTPHNISTTTFNRLINQAAVDNVQRGEITSLGQYYQDQLHSRSTQ